MDRAADRDLAARRQGERYLVSADERAAFERDGWVHLAGVLSDDELRPIEETYMRFLRREVAVPGKDFCDMSSDYAKPVEEWRDEAAGSPLAGRDGRLTPERRSPPARPSL